MLKVPEEIELGCVTGVLRHGSGRFNRDRTHARTGPALRPFRIWALPVLVAARLLKSLGNPLPNSVKYFATVELLELSDDRAWLAKATNAVGQHWKRKNLRKKGRSGPVAEAGASAGGGNLHSGMSAP